MTEGCILRWLAAMFVLVSMPLCGAAKSTTDIVAMLVSIRQAIEENRLDTAFDVTVKLDMAAAAYLREHPPSGRTSSPTSSGEAPVLLDLVARAEQGAAAGQMTAVLQLSSEIQQTLKAEMKRQSPSPLERLNDLQTRTMRLTSEERLPYLSRLAQAAFDANQREQARGYAIEMLSASGKGLSEGARLYHGNMILGRLAMQDGDIASARDYLLAAGKTNGSPVLCSFGPGMALARDLLNKGERKAVLEYLGECERFWSSGHDRLSKWRDSIAKGQVPGFGANGRR